MLFRLEASVCMLSQYFFMFLGKISYLIKKSHIRRFDSTISSIANLEMLLHLIVFDDSYIGVTLEQF